MAGMTFRGCKISHRGAYHILLRSGGGYADALRSLTQGLTRLTRMDFMMHTPSEWMPTLDYHQDCPSLHTLKHQKSLRRLSASLTHDILRKAILPYAAYAARELPYAEPYADFF